MPGARSTMKRRSQQLNSANNVIASEQRKLEREWMRLDKAFKSRNRQIVRYTHTLEDELTEYENEKIKNSKESRPYKGSELLENMDDNLTPSKKQKHAIDVPNARPVSAVVCKARLALRKIDLARENLEKKKRLKEFVKAFHGINPDTYMGSCTALSTGRTNLRRHSVSSLPSTIISDRDLMGHPKSRKPIAVDKNGNTKTTAKEVQSKEANDFNETASIEKSIDAEVQSESVKNYERSYVSGFQIHKNDSNNHAFLHQGSDTKLQDQTLEEVFSRTYDNHQDTLDAINGNEPIIGAELMAKSSKPPDVDDTANVSENDNLPKQNASVDQEVDEMTKDVKSLRMSDDLASYNRGKNHKKLLKRSNTIDAMDISRLCVHDDELNEVNIIIDSAGHLPSALSQELSASIDSLDTIEEKDSTSKRTSIWTHGNDETCNFRKTSIAFMKQGPIKQPSREQSNGRPFGNQTYPQTTSNKGKSVTVSKLINSSPNAKTINTSGGNGVSLPKLGSNRERRPSLSRLVSDTDEQSFENEDSFKPLRIEAPKLKGIPYHTGNRVGARRNSIQLQHMLEEMREHRSMAELIQMKNNK
ncbi:unnamed protein product [Owenia fusiformis]|nr:unnamed protein product [Owenia fusiformis]